jgi:hypothetical protein
MIPFTQYLRPNGEKRDVAIDRPADIEKLAEEFIARGGYFEAEVLRSGHVSLTACHPDCETIDCVTIVVPNGIGMPEVVDKLVRKAHAWRPDQDAPSCA